MQALWTQQIFALFLLRLPMVARSFTPVLTEQTVPSPGSIEDFKKLTVSSYQKKPGSKGFQRAWVTWIPIVIDHIRYDWSRNLPHPVDVEATTVLEFRLGQAADVGTMPSFEDPGSRSGYALDFLSARVNRLAGTLFSKMPQDEMVEAALARFFAQDDCKVTSIGGGPGYDYVAVCLVAAFMNRDNRAEACSIRGMVFDYEPGWGDLVTTLGESTSRILDEIQDSHNSCTWGGRCDITVGMDDEVNRGCRETLASTDIFVCQYCVAENAVKLRDSKYIFFSDLFQQANEGALFVLTEVTHRLWPDIADLVVEDGGFDVTFVKNRSLQLVLQKRAGAMVSAEVLARCTTMRRDYDMHSRKLDSGYERQIKKKPGAKS